MGKSAETGTMGKSNNSTGSMHCAESGEGAATGTLSQRIYEVRVEEPNVMRAGKPRMMRRPSTTFRSRWRGQRRGTRRGQSGGK